MTDGLAERMAVRAEGVVAVMRLVLKGGVFERTCRATAARKSNGRGRLAPDQPSRG